MTESASLKVFEHAFYVGSYLSGILYGINLILYFAVLHSVLRATKGRDPVPRKNLYALFSTALTVLVTIDIIANAFWGEQMWITFRDAPGGVPGFIAQESSVWYQTLGSTCGISMVLVADAFLLYRLFIIYGSRYAVIALPALVWLAGLALAFIQLYLSGKPNGNILQGRAQEFGISYYTITISFNIVLTLLIAARLRKMGKFLSRRMGHERTNMYTGLQALIVESAAPFSLIGFMFLIPYAIEAPTAITFGQIWGKMACFFPQMIIWRIVTRRAWTRQLVFQSQSGIIPTGHEAAEGSVGSRQDPTVIAENSVEEKNDQKSSTESVV